MAAADSWILQVFGIIKPSDRSNASSEGSRVILDAKGEYIVALTSQKVYKVSIDRVTPQGAQLLANVNGWIAATSERYRNFKSGN